MAGGAAPEAMQAGCSAEPPALGAVPAEVLRYLAGLDDAAASALLARARGLGGAPSAAAGGAAAPAAAAGAAAGATCGAVGEDCHGRRAGRCGAAQCSACVGSGEDTELQVDASHPEDLADAAATSEALICALQAGDLLAAEALRRTADLGHLGESGWTCLHWAVHVAGTALATHGSGSQAPAPGLMTAEPGCGCCAPESAELGSRELLRRMLGELGRSAGAALADARNADGATPLMFAADAGDSEACEWLLAAGATLAARDADGDTAAAWARAKGHAELARRLEKTLGGAA